MYTLDFYTLCKVENRDKFDLSSTVYRLLLCRSHTQTSVSQLKFASSLSCEGRFTLQVS